MPYAGLSVRSAVSGSTKTFQIEEFVPKNSEEPWVRARYMHAIRDMDAQTFIHCDGAVKAYRCDEYPETLAGFKQRPKGQHYRKAFRLDGAIPTDTWGHLIAAWFRGNKLAREYLAGDGGPSPG